MKSECRSPNFPCALYRPRPRRANLTFDLIRALSLNCFRYSAFGFLSAFGILAMVLATGMLHRSHLNAQPAKDHPGPAFPESFNRVLENTRPLEWARGERLPLYVLPISNTLSDTSNAEAEHGIRLLNERGIGYTVSWNQGSRETSVKEGLRIGAIQQRLGLRVAVDATSCLHSFFDGSPDTLHVNDDGETFADGSFTPGRKMGCPFALEHRLPVIKDQVEYFLKRYREASIDVDFAFADWEIDGPIEWNDAWANSKLCRRCRANINNIGDFREFQKRLRRIRSEIQHVAFGANVKAYFPEALVGNYGVYPHQGLRYWYDYFEKPVRDPPCVADQSACYREWAHEFGGTGYTFAMPVVYTWYPTYAWYDYAETDYRWFYNMLLVASNAGSATPPEIPIISFVHWTTTAPPLDPDPAVRPLSRGGYQELLWHMLLRGHDGLFLWCLQKELASEIELLHQVYAASLQFNSFFESGTPITQVVPKESGTVVSGLQLGEQVLVRRTDFTSTKESVLVRIGDRNLVVPAGPSKCQILQLN